MGVRVPCGQDFRVSAVSSFWIAATAWMPSIQSRALIARLVPLRERLSQFSHLTLNVILKPRVIFITNALWLAVVLLFLVLSDIKRHMWLCGLWCWEGDVTRRVGVCVWVRACAHTRVFVHSCCIRALFNAISRHPGLSTVAPPVHYGPPVPTTVIPLPPGTHLLFAQTGKIERLPLEGSTMTKSEAKTLLHTPVSVGWWHFSDNFCFHDLEQQAGCGQTRDWD